MSRSLEEWGRKGGSEEGVADLPSGKVLAVNDQSMGHPTGADKWTQAIVQRENKIDLRAHYCAGPHNTQLGGRTGKISQVQI